VEPEETDLARQRLVTTFRRQPTDTHAVTKELLEVVFTVGSMQRLYTGDQLLVPRRK
jgi:hypothetical protein